MSWTALRSVLSGNLLTLWRAGAKHASQGAPAHDVYLMATWHGTQTRAWGQLGPIPPRRRAEGCGAAGGCWGSELPRTYGGARITGQDKEAPVGQNVRAVAVYR